MVHLGQGSMQSEQIFENGIMKKREDSDSLMQDEIRESIRSG